MGRPRTEKTNHIRVKVSLLDNMRKEFPTISSDGDRVATIFDHYKKVQSTIDNVGGFLYGKQAWKKTFKK